MCDQTNFIKTASATVLRDTIRTGFVQSQFYDDEFTAIYNAVLSVFHDRDDDNDFILSMDEFSDMLECSNMSPLEIIDRVADDFDINDAYVICGHNGYYYSGSDPEELIKRHYNTSDAIRPVVRVLDEVDFSDWEQVAALRRSLYEADRNGVNVSSALCAIAERFGIGVDEDDPLDDILKDADAN